MSTTTLPAPGTGTPAFKVGEIEHADPRTLLLDRNIRKAEPDDAMKASVAKRGVLVPIVAVITADGDRDRLRVRMGERRTKAAIAVTRPTVPVYVIGYDSPETDQEIERLISQRDENTHRQGLTTSEDVGVIEQLALLGLSDEQIAEQAQIDLPSVAASRKVAKSKAATEAARNHAALSLEQAAAIAEFDDDAAIVEKLSEAVYDGKFDHVLQRARDERHREQMTAERTASAEAAGLKVIPRPGYDDERTTLPLDRLLDRESNPLSEETHKHCPGRVAWLQHSYKRVDLVQGCTGWRGHGHRDSSRARPPVSDLSPEEREKRRAHLKLVKDNHLAWDSAESVRRTWIVSSLARAKTAPKGTSRFIAQALSRDNTALSGEGPRHLAAEWLGIKGTSTYTAPDVSPAKSVTESRCTVVALVQVLAAYESRLNRESWRHNGTDNDTGRYLRFLASAGYQLSDVEEYAVSDQTA